jgi:two-component system LytT family sensor kinase
MKKYSLNGISSPPIDSPNRITAHIVVEPKRNVVYRLKFYLSVLGLIFDLVMQKELATNISIREILFQVVLHILVFIFYSFDKTNPDIQPYQVVYFLTYTVAAFIINYFLLPRFLYKKKYLWFIVYVALIAAALIVIEELVLEQIYFPDTRAKRFPGVFFTLLGVLPILTILSGFKFAWDALMKQHEVEALKQTVQESELQFLKSQINPHFLFNNLNNLYAYAIEDSPKTPEIILELSGVLRYMLYECREDYVPLAKEIDQIGNFIKLNELQIEERGTVSFQTGAIPSPYRIAPLILIVFIENAFKHSTASQSDSIDISVSLVVSQEGRLHFMCKNTYLPNGNKDNLSNGIGLENVKKRLQLLYPGKHKLIIRDSGKEYEIELQMDLKN